MKKIYVIILTMILNLNFTNLLISSEKARERPFQFNLQLPSENEIQQIRCIRTLQSLVEELTHNYDIIDRATKIKPNHKFLTEKQLQNKTIQNKIIWTGIIIYQQIESIKKEEQSEKNL